MQIGLILVVELAVNSEDATLAWACHRALDLLSRVLLTHQARWVLTQSHKATPVHLPCDAIGSHGLFGRDGIWTALHILPNSSLVYHRGVKVCL